jgi:hypothetical protein
MQPRDIFDGLMLAILLVVLYVQVFGLSFSSERLQTVIDVLFGLDLVFYLVMAGILAIGFLGYMFVYLPQKQSTNPTQ